MTATDFFGYIEEQLEKDLPFVVYSMPNTFEIKAVLQKDTALYKIENFEESGFVFAPFDVRKDAILIPYSKSRSIMTLDDIPIQDKEGVAFNEINDKAHHLHLVSKGIDAISEGSFKKVVLSRKEHLELASKVEAINIFKTLLHNYNSAFVYCWYHPAVGLWLGATPETLLEIDRNRVSTMALAGTQDYEGTLDVIWKAKEREEQQMVADFVVDSLKDQLVDVEVSSVKTVKAGRLLHLRTDISGQLKPDAQSLQKLILKLHPTPAVCGLPKIDAMQFILDNEHYNREFYTGFLGELNREIKISPRAGRRNIENRAYSFNKRATHLFVNLRCMQLRNDEAILYVGGGITKDSEPEKEWVETVNKTKTMKNVFFFLELAVISIFTL